MEGSRLESAALLMLVASINIVFLYGIIMRPNIYYTLYTSLNYDEMIDFSVEDLDVEAKINNRGSIKASIWLVVRFYNATLKEPPHQEYKQRDEGELLIPMILEPDQSRYKSICMKFSVKGEPSYILIMIFVEANRNISYNFNNSFMLTNPQRPTAILLKMVSEGKYMRVKSR